jgi:hypothetical protein
MSRLKPSSLVWIRLKTVLVIGVTRDFVRQLVGRTTRLASLDNLTFEQLITLNQLFAKTSNETLEGLFLEFVKGRGDPEPPTLPPPERTR